MSIAAALLTGASGTPVTVEIVASGHVETPADRYRISGSVLACAATQAEADALLAQKTAAITRTMSGMRVTPAAVAGEKLSFASMMGAMSAGRGASECNKSGLDDMLSAAADEKAKDKPAAKVGASAPLSFDARDAATASRAIAALKAADAKPSDKAIPVLLDETAAKRSAKQQALAKARVEAEAYGAPLGFGTATLTGISERQDWGSLDFMGQIMRTIGLAGAGPSDKVVTDVTLTVSFRLEGR
ncbi:SIMPL domain-containing protein [Sphingomonas sp. Leaf357]|uniref:SIMPL domain-containing protein n=1 Tax=Sphingomonas sp. Leaf357 TaxID=1736350 RepID=UPI001443E158|nr:SIMPL domain-containing protein [Sphingomonas sp. Leaf357]